MAQRKTSPAPNYTNPALMMLGLNLTCAFFVLWAIYGLVPVLLLAVTLNHMITRLDDRRARQDWTRGTSRF